MTSDIRLALFDAAAVIGFLVLAVASAWWWSLFAAGAAFIGYRQLRLVSRRIHRPDAPPH